jgi:hypothetical protein
MKPDHVRVLAAIDRNFAEANDALMELTAYDSLRRARLSDARPNFFAIAEQALFNDMVAGAIRVFDDHKDVASLWYVMRCHRAVAQGAAQACGIDIDELKSITARLRHIRDKIHFHIDRHAVTEPALVWTHANISTGQFSHALHAAALLLAKIRQEVYGGEPESIAAYDGSDVERIIAAYAAAEQAGGT